MVLTRRQFVRAAGSAFLSGTMAGCAFSRETQGRETVLHIADWGGADPLMAKLQKEAEAEWNRRFPQINVRPEHIPGSGEYVSKMLTSFVAGTEPEILCLDASSAAAFIENDTLLDLTPLIQKENFDLSVYYPNVLDMARRGPKLYALPADFTPMMLYYNKRLFDTAGVPYPKEGWTWDEFRTACERLTVTPPGTTRPTQFGFSMENWMPGWIMWLWQNNGDVLTADGKQATGALDSPASIEAVTFFTDLVKHRLAPSVSETQAQGASPFASGLVAMQISGHWSIVGLKSSERITLEDVGVVGLPQKKRRITVLYEMGYAITRRCPRPAEAWEYIKFLSGPYFQQKRAELGVGISAHRAIAESRRTTSPLEPAFLDNIRYGIPPWGARVENYAPVEDLGKEMVEEILVGNVPVPVALRAAARRMDAELMSSV